MQHFIPVDITNEGDTPAFFTNPFDYVAHPFCIKAQKHLQNYLPNPSLLEKGKMYGVLVASNANGETGFIAAYSGNETNDKHNFPFVPQVYDITNPNGFFRKEEQKLNAINQEFETLKTSSSLNSLKQSLFIKKNEFDAIIKSTKEKIKTAKAKRAIQRQSTSDEAILAQLIKESQREKSQFNRLKKDLKRELDQLENKLMAFELKISQLEKKRKTLSAKVQAQLFDNYIFLNANGEKASASEIFRLTDAKLPPAGTGDCAAPKLLQYAFKNQLTPIVMAEFWWGPSPATTVRKHGYYYPACKSKCEPVLGFMLQGLSIAPKAKTITQSIKVIYDDAFIAVINKPSGLLSVPGKSDEPSVYTQVRNLYPNADEPLIVHRLDMATSGLMIITKTKKAYVHLQKQFLKQSVKKRYVAILDGIIDDNEGTIKLPLRVDIDDRPRQLVCFDHGKPAITKWEVIKRSENQTYIYFYPQTGRTHQLRVHAAHSLGLNTPMIGDRLYGKESTRLMLHAEKIDFIHPETEKPLSFQQKADF